MHDDCRSSDVVAIFIDCCNLCRFPVSIADRGIGVRGYMHRIMLTNTLCFRDLKLLDPGSLY